MNFIIKCAIIIFLFVVLYYQIYKNANFSEAVLHVKNSITSNYHILIVVFLLMIVNWSLETIKWKFLIDRFHHISWMDAIEGILFGITFSLFTPSRIGEFGGRVFALQNDRLQAIVSTLLGSATQIVVNISLGTFGFVLFLLYESQIEIIYLFGVIFMVLLLISLAHLCLYNIDYLVNKFPHNSKLKNYLKYIDIIKLYNAKDIFKIEFLSVLKYLVYVFQFMLLIYFFDIEIKFSVLLISTISMFFLQTINPLNIALIDFGFRGNVALFIFSKYTSNNLDILAATIILWFINLIIPAIFGGISALRFKFITEK